MQNFLREFANGLLLRGSVAMIGDDFSKFINREVKLIDYSILEDILGGDSPELRDYYNTRCAKLY